LAERAIGDLMRVARRNVPGTVYHLISRFVDRDWFVRDEEERENYLRLLGRAFDESDWRCLAYAIMSNHIHLAALAGEDALASWTNRVHSPFAVWMNQRHQRLGPLFVRGPDDYAVEPNRVGALIAYIHNNPVRAGVVAHARMSSWTSHRAYIGATRSEPWLDVTEGLALSGFEDGKTFEAWVETAPDDPCRVELEGVRRSVRRRGTITLATPTLTEPVTTPLLARPATWLRIDPARVVQITAAAIGVPVTKLCSRNRSPVLAMGRRIAVYVANVIGIHGSDIAAALALSPSRVSRILHTKSDDEVLRLSRLVIERLRDLYGQVNTVPQAVL
jgi:putative transposase